MSITNQVVSIFAGISGLLDEVDVKRVSEFEEKMHEYLQSHSADVLAKLAEKNEFTDELKAKLTEAINAFKKTFN